MKDSSHVLFNFRSERWPEAQQFLTAIGRPDLAEGPEQTFGYSFDFDSDDDLENFRRQAARFGFADDYTLRRDRHYTHEDLSAAPLLWVTVTLGQRGEGGPTHGTRYDLSQACPACGSGARQTSALVLKPGDLPSKAKLSATYDDEILLREEVAESLIDGGFPRAAFGPVLSAGGGREPLPWRQVLALAELPPMSPQTRGLMRESGCRECGRDGYFHDGKNPIEIRYDLGDAKLDGLPAVAATWERFGNSRLRTPIEGSHFAAPLVVVKQEIYRLLRGAKLRGLAFYPVEAGGHTTGGDAEG